MNGLIEQWGFQTEFTNEVAQITLPISFTSTSSYIGVLGETHTYGGNDYTVLYKKLSASKIQINSPYNNPCGWYLKGY